MKVVGVGVDIEGARDIRRAMTRFFLNPSEQETPEREWLRLWTVKESLFKACPVNDGLLLSDFAVDAPLAMAGTARLTGNEALLFHYTSKKMEKSFVSFAVCEEVKK